MVGIMHLWSIISEVFKSEWMPKECYLSYPDAEKDIMQYIEHYNNYRVHSYNNYITLAVAEKSFKKNLLKCTDLLDYYTCNWLPKYTFLKRGATNISRTILTG